MAKINNVGLNLGQKIANPFKTSRNSTTNPFKYQNFEGKTLEVELFADVFEQKSASKSKIVSSTVAGSMNKLHSLLPESVVNFVNRIREGISSAWDYAKNTNISDVKGFRTISSTLNMDVVDIGKGLSNSIAGMGHHISEKMEFLNTDIVDIGKGLSSKMEFLNTDITDIGRGLSDRWSSLISKVSLPHHNRITKETPVADLRAMWIEHNNSIAEREVA